MPEQAGERETQKSWGGLPLGAVPAAWTNHLASSEVKFFDSLDRSVNATLARFTLGISPLAVASDYLDWATHLAASPGKQLRLFVKAVNKAQYFGLHVLRSALDPRTPPCIAPLPQDRRFTNPAWQMSPYSLVYQAFLLQQQWFHSAMTGVRGVSKHDEESMSFAARQWLDMVSPSNHPLLNPEILMTTRDQGGLNLVRGLWYFLDDAERSLTAAPPAGSEAFPVGGVVAVTPGKVVFRNRLIELMQYEPATPQVQREPVLLQSAWMMKYYIMDLSPQHSLIKYLVDQGHTVFAVSWHNPGAEDRDLGMEDYRRLGTMAALDAINAILPGRKIHAVGYCLGGILLSIAAAAMARDGDERLASVTLFTTMTDFTEVGELAVFMDPGEVAFLDDMMWQQGYLEAKQVAGGFQLLRSRDLLWSRMVSEYFLGRRDQPSDLMAWNADGTRMAYRQHSELIRRLYRDNELFEGRYCVEGRPVQLGDIHVPVFCVAAETDHVAPWRSVFKLHLQTEATEFSFVLTSGGHNAGIISEPGHPHRHYRLRTCLRGDIGVDPNTWRDEVSVCEGSWWPAWQEWLCTHSTGQELPPSMGAAERGLEPLCDAPGTYVHER